MTGTLRSIHAWVGIAVGLLLLPAALGTAPLPAGAAKDTTKRAARRDGWPETRPGELRATLLASDLTRHEFVFTVQSEPPYKLVSVGRMEHRTGHGGFKH